MVEIDVRTLSDKELLDIYDAWIGDKNVDFGKRLLRVRELRAEVNRRRLMTTPTLESVAKVLVINEKHEVLILTVGDYKERPDKSFKPDLPGGRVDPGESELAAVRRELIEETSISINQDEFTLAYTKTEFYASENKSVTKLVYIVHLQDTPEVTISWEHASYEWVLLNDIDRVELRPFHAEAMHYCLANGLL